MYLISMVCLILRLFSLCDEMGLKVILRCSPFMCSEWDFGGLPAWLLRSDECAVRCMDDEYISAVIRYTKEVCKRIIPYLSTNGGRLYLLELKMNMAVLEMI